MFESLFGEENKAAKTKMKKSTAQVLELEGIKKKLEIDRDQITLELENMKKRQNMKIEEEAHKHRLKLESERAIFDREKEIWKKEKQELIDRNTREKEEFETNLKRNLEITHNEAVTLVKLDSQQKIKQAELDKERSVNELKAENAKAIAEIQAKESEKYHDKLNNALQEIMLNGDKNTKFVQEMALKLIDKAPTPAVDIGVDITSGPKQLAEAKVNE